MTCRAMRYPTYYLPLGDLTAWMDVAVPGDGVTYARGPALDPDHPAARLIAEWIASGLVVTAKCRAADGALLHQAQRRTPPPSASLRLAGEFATTPEGRMLRLIETAARTGLPCPSYAAMAKALGLRDARAARHRLTNLARMGKVTINQGQRGRVVAIVAIGLATADAVIEGD